MLRNTTTIALIIATLGAASVPAMADNHKQRGDRPHAEKSDRGHHSRMHRGGRGGNRMGQMMENFDTNGDGQLTQEEIDTARAAKLAEFDADGDGQLTLEEYQALWLDAMRERMVDRFQSHDDDGDGQVTVEEFNEDFANIVDRMDRNDDGVLSSDDRRRQRQGADAEGE